MKVLSLLQPWATLVVIGAKKIETRSWNTKYRGPLLIHASQKLTREQKEICRDRPFRDHLAKFIELPLGAIIGKVDLETTETTTFIKNAKSLEKRSNNRKDGVLQYRWDFTETEEAFGDYSSGRYGWLLKDPVAFTHQIPAKGSLGLWDYDERICLGCGCSEMNCARCIEKTGSPCYWVKDNLCSACLPESPTLGIKKDALIS